VKILVTGGLGFIGHKVVKILQSDHSVDLYDSLTNYGTVDQTELDWLLDKRKQDIIGQQIIGDIRDYNLLRKTFFIDHPEVVVHLASFPRAKVVDTDPVMGSEVMINALLRMLIECKQNGTKRFVFVSSSMVYGDFLNGVTEQALCHPKGTYANLKYAGELLVKDFCTQNNIEYVIVRPSAVYGPLDVADRVVAKFMQHAINNEPIVVKGASEILDFTYVDDIATGISLAATHPDAANNTYNMTRGQGITLFSAATLIKAISNSTSEIILQDKDTKFPSRGALSVAKAHFDLGYSPLISVSEGFQLYHEWIIKHSVYCLK
jgi:nucleoside-diphosphate-sugar epimerase